MTIVTGVPERLRAVAPARSPHAAEALADVEAERAAVSRLLHDEVLQSLVMARWMADRSGDQAVSDAVRAAIGEATSAMWALKPRTEDGTLVRALDSLADRYAPDRIVTVRADGVPDRIDPAAATVAYRVVQCAVASCRAGTVDVRVELRSGVLTVLVCDDGPAYDHAVHEPDSELTRWLARAGALGGSARVSDSPTGGTTIRVEIPGALAKELP
ncbi:MAG TPA: hypothetical protein VFQ85_16350 [Mycobacteriales bacterium]|jgi:signal transduction histidine kinase|nr:hypothetical protein [Mycobacteriales bacterium]